MSKVDKICTTCGSTNVRLNANMEWDERDQRWSLSLDGGEHDSTWCVNCDAETEIADLSMEVKGASDE